MSGEVFGFLDEYYMAHCLTTSQIRESIDNCEIRIAVAKCVEGSDMEDEADRFPWNELRECLERALKLKKAGRTVTPSKPGRIDLEAVKQRNDIVTVIERYTRLRKSGSRYSGKCPIHNDKNPSLIVYPDRQSFHCFGCGKGGDVISFVEAVENTDLRGAVVILGGG